MSRLLLVYAGQPGGRIHRMVNALQRIISDSGEPITLVVRPALQATAADLLDASGLLLATPEHFGYMAGALKDIFDRTFYPVEGKTTGLPYALLVSAGTDGTGTCRAVERIARGYGWREIAAPLIVVGDITDEALSQVAELGVTLAAGLAAGIF